VLLVRLSSHSCKQQWYCYLSLSGAIAGAARVLPSTTNTLLIETVLVGSSIHGSSRVVGRVTDMTTDFTDEANSDSTCFLPNCFICSVKIGLVILISTIMISQRVVSFRW
jgi:hypothetical protein